MAAAKQNCPPPSSLVIQLTGTIFELNSRIKETNVLSKFHENWAKNVTSTVFTCFHYIHIEKNAPPTGSHVFSPIQTILKLVRDINKTNVLTNFHDDWAKIVTSRVFTRENCHYIQRKESMPPCSDLASLRGSMPSATPIRRVNARFDRHVQIIWPWQKNAPPNGGHVFSPISTMFTRKTAPPTRSHVFQQIGTTF
ncbi:hypothetical protein DPMN_006251 [Dreissena polymorpha]|uniref:Uncharacterized protein n=1 Tax=Dreissena polymorpha TaxID=45954 RepID=A0A9D4RUQ3_DREPO|nr:hypothetical protein DPMN_006251 [Dreissena polymorpha]